MKNIFFYPTIKNTLVGFVLAQLFPVILLGMYNKFLDLGAWLQIELVILGCLSLWQIKPISELDEREKEITLKWKSRMLDYGAALVLLPLFVLGFNPSIDGWNLFTLTAVPVFIVFIVCTLLTKRELGYFFYEETI